MALRPPVDRYLLLSRIEESVNGVELAVNQYPGAIHPRGHEHLVSFDRSPRWVWNAGSVQIEKRLMLIEGTMVVRYSASKPCVLRARPLIAFRD